MTQDFDMYSYFHQAVSNWSLNINTSLNHNLGIYVLVFGTPIKTSGTLITVLLVTADFQMKILKGEGGFSC